jgi:dCTP deaminase
MAEEHDIINPYTEKPVTEEVISYGVLSYGYDLRVADEFKIFTNVHRTIVDPNHFDARSFVTVNAMSRSSRRIRLRWRGRSSTSRFRAMC